MTHRSRLKLLKQLVDSAILGFAVTGPQRTESLSQATNKPVSAAAAYADPKATHQDTGRLCSEQGVHFQPMVAETTGAWDKTASHVLHIVAAAVAAREGAAVADLYSRLLQELSITTRRAGHKKPCDDGPKSSIRRSPLSGRQPSCSKDELRIWMSRLRAGT